MSESIYVDNIYLDNQATTQVDQRVLDAMLPYFTELYGNAGSVTHRFGETAREAVQVARQQVAAAIGADPSEIVFTSGATESNNLALKGILLSPRARGQHVVSVSTEHRAILDPLQKLSRSGFEVTRLPVAGFDSATPGLVDLDRVRDSLTDRTALVSVMLANNEIGVVQPIREIAQLCRERSIPLHTDATQAIGKLPVDVDELDVDLMSFSAHKLHGPKGVGGLYVRRRNRRLRLEPQQDGGGQERGFRSGTLNVPGIVGLGSAVELATATLASEIEHLQTMRNHLWQRLQENFSAAVLNGPPLEQMESRLPNNLNCGFPGIDGEALMIQVPQLALSSGSACTSTDPEPSHVLRAIGLDEDQIRASLRFGVSRFSTIEQMDQAADWLAEAAEKLGRLS